MWESNQEKLLGLVIDKKLNFDGHFNSLQKCWCYGHILDHVYLNRKKLEVKSNVVVDRYGINTDHFPIIIELPLMEKEIKKIEKKCIRKIKDVNIQILKEDFKEACKNAISLSNFESNYKNFHVKCEEIINNHAPKIEITSKNKPKMPWMDAEFRQCRSLRRKYEKIGKKTREPRKQEEIC